MRIKFNYYWLFAVIILVFIVWYVREHNSAQPVRRLPVYGPSRSAADTAHKVPPFSFTDQDGETVTDATVRGKIFVTEFFFTTCKTICPVMNNNLVRVYNEFVNRPDFLILSHTVDPETDSVSVLKEYALRHGVKDRRWLFVTGDKKQLYTMARKFYLLDSAPAAEEDDFVHTQNFALIDKKGNLRGFYDGTDSLEINRLITEIKVLSNE